MRRICCAAVLAALLLTGCAQAPRSYSSVRPHEEAHTHTDPVQIEIVSDYDALLSTLELMVNDHSQSMSIDVSQYGDDLESGFMTAKAEMKTIPVCAFAVQDMKLTISEVGARRIAQAEIIYRRTAEQVEEIHTIWGAAAMERTIAQSLESAVPQVTILMNGYTPMDLNRIAAEYYEAHLDTIMERPLIGAEIYPSSGNVRILELKFHYLHSQEDQLKMRRETQSMLSSAAGYVRGQTDQMIIAERLYSLLLPLYNEELVTSTPVYSLLCVGQGTGSSVATVYRLLCSQAGLECMVVHGSREGEPWDWNLLKIRETYYHVDILAGMDSWNLPLRFDNEMDGYEWDREAYPESVRPQVDPPQPLETEPTGEETEPDPGPTGEPEPDETTEEQAIDEETEPTEPEMG